MSNFNKIFTLVYFLFLCFSLILLTGRPAAAQIVVGEVKQLLVIVDYEPYWSPDGKRIVFISNRNGPFNVYVMNANGSNVIRLTNQAAADDTPSWSPDGSQIAFVSERDGNSEIYLINADGGNLRRLTKHPGEDLHPNWSNDSRRILFNSTRASANQANPDTYDIYSMSTTGSEIQRLTAGGINTYASFSPDGKRILFRRSTGENLSEIVVMNADGTKPRVLSQVKAFDGWASWSPVGSRILFASDRIGSFQIYAMNADGSGVQQLVAKPGRYTNPRWSPDGSQIIFTGRADRDTRIFKVEVKRK